MPGLIRGVARTAAVVGTATAVSNGVSRRQAGRWAAKDAAAAPPPEEAPPQYAPPAQGQAPAEEMDAKLAQLEQLGKLKEQGVLTETEFAVQKDRILNS